MLQIVTTILLGEAPVCLINIGLHLHAIVLALMLKHYDKATCLHRYHQQLILLILFTKFGCTTGCTEANSTILGGNERWKSGNSRDTKMIEKDWIDVILDAIWVAI